jgi:ElaB/YqjD/DUF883 family membrane-anchored ribosome-binding protein
MAMDFSTDQVVADLRALVSQMEGLLAEGGSKVRDRLGEASAGLESHLRDAKARLARVEHQASRKLRRAARWGDRYAHDSPWQVSGASLLTGIVIGIVIGWTLGSRQD